MHSPDFPPSTGVLLFDALTGAVIATALVALGFFALCTFLYVLYFGVRLALASSTKRAALWAALRVRWTWRRACISLNLYETIEKTQVVDGKTKTRTSKKVPKMRVRVDDYGVRVRIKTLPKVGREELIKHAQHFSDTWRCTRVAVLQDKPGKVLIRGVIIDPLTVDHPYVPAPVSDPFDPFRWDLGIDEWAEPTTLNLRNIPGVVVAGLPGYGKSALVNRGMVHWSKSALIQLAALDGKGGGDFDDIEDRLFHKGGDSIEECNEFLVKLEEHRQERSSLLRKVFNTKSIWNVPGAGKNGGTGPGFTEDFPLIIATLDEAHTFFRRIPDAGSSKEFKKRNALAAHNAILVEELVKKGRSAGILMVLPTQKPTSDAMPTAIRDNCPIALSFAVKTIDAAVAALGDDIRKYPEANPVDFQGEDYRLVATLAKENAPGFKRIKASYVPDDQVEYVANQNAELTRNPFETIKVYQEQEVSA